MNRVEEMKAVLSKASFNPSQIRYKVILSLILFGAIAFVASLLLSDAVNAWQGLLVNILFFAGIAQGALCFSVIATVTDSYWLRPIKRVAEGLSFFGIYSIALFILMFFGGSYLYEWYNHDLVLHTKEGWLNVPFFVTRQVLGMLFLLCLSYFYLRNSIKPDLDFAASMNKFFQGRFSKIWTGKAENFDASAEAGYKSNKMLAPWVGFLSGVVLSFIAFDWIMSLDQSWFSTMFGVQYFVSSLIGAGAFLIIISGIMQQRFGLGQYQTILRHHDMAKLTFAFTLLWTYMIFAQVLVIWYANLPEETPYLILRIQSTQWSPVYWVIFFMMFIIPFFGLMSRTACRSILFSRIIAIDILCGLWLEKYFMVVPSVQENTLRMQAHAGQATLDLIPGFQFLPFIIAICIGVGVLGLFCFSFMRFLKGYPAMAIGDNRLISTKH